MTIKYKYSILTIIMGNYELLHEIQCPLQEDVEYICVTDNPNLKSNTWKIVYDKDLDKKEYNGFDRTFRVRYNLFKYCSSDICVRIDGSLQLCKSLDTMIDKFIEGDYDIGITIHPDRCLISEELKAWEVRKIFQYNIQTNYIINVIKYPINTLGLIQLNLSINKRSSITDKIDNDMLNILYDKRLTQNNHINRLDQTLFTAYIGKYHNNLKIFGISNNITTGNFLQQYYHGLNIPVNTMFHKFNNYILFNKYINVFPYF